MRANNHAAICASPLAISRAKHFHCRARPVIVHRPIIARVASWAATSLWGRYWHRLCRAWHKWRRHRYFSLKIPPSSRRLCFRRPRLTWLQPALDRRLQELAKAHYRGSHLRWYNMATDTSLLRLILCVSSRQMPGDLSGPKSVVNHWPMAFLGRH